MLSKYLDKEKHSNELPTKQSSETITSNTQKNDNKKYLTSSTKVRDSSGRKSKSQSSKVR